MESNPISLQLDTGEYAVTHKIHGMGRDFLYPANTECIFRLAISQQRLHVLPRNWMFAIKNFNIEQTVKDCKGLKRDIHLFSEEDHGEMPHIC